MDDADQILELMARMEANNSKSGMLFLLGDGEKGEVSIFSRGQRDYLAMAILHQMDNNKEFRKLILASINVFLSRNPDHMNSFMASIGQELSFADAPIGLN